MDPRISLVCPHDKIMDTVDALVPDPACHFCGGMPLVIVWRSSADKIVAACEKHRQIVEEMIERDRP